MTAQEAIAKIRAEIERGIKERTEWLKDKTAPEFQVTVWTTLNDEDRAIISFLDTLEEETSYDTQKYTPRPSVSIEDVARVQFASHAKVIEKKRKAIFDWEQFKEVAGIFYGFGKKDSSDTLEEESSADKKAVKEISEFTAKEITRQIKTKFDLDKLREVAVPPREEDVKMAEERRMERAKRKASEESVCEDLEKEAVSYCFDNGLNLSPRVATDFARHFYELGHKEEPAKPSVEDAMKRLDEKIALVKKRGTWNGVDVDKYMDEVRGKEPEKPVPKDLEEAAEKKYPVYWKDYPKDGIARSELSYDTNKQCRDAFIAGAKWGAEHLKK